ncbi:TetR-like C-terminal domain-containing protein [Frankia sp. Cppng1_Ct_nod]|uniref:TetR-like C-terminal domain-containing protein n=1 Tax=Frankia sp. Cppng1_Ct_nod TaxID=2897162 RepID=UPI001041634D|nr:TetR-like C-terminal domain-containing protein [Frankia sp. Cppng1_Ct_nod]
MVPAESRPRGRPRDDSVDARVLSAAVEELADKGIAEFSVTSVAARAKAAKRSIYARWPRREDLILAGMSTLAAGLTPPRTGTIVDDLVILLDGIAAVFVEPRRSILQRCVAEIEQFPQLYQAFKRDSIDRCLAAIEDAFRDAAARGEIRNDVNSATVAEALTGVAVLRASFSLEPVLPVSIREEIVSVLLDGLRPRHNG